MLPGVFCDCLFSAQQACHKLASPRFTSLGSHAINRQIERRRYVRRTLSNQSNPFGHVCTPRKHLSSANRRSIIRTRSYEANPDVYSWNGNRYVKNNSQFPELYNDELASLVRDAYSTEALPTNARLSSSKRAVEIYLMQGRYAEAVALCNGMIRLIDDPKLTKPNSIITEKNTPEQLARIAATFEIEKAEGKAKIHHLFGGHFPSCGKLGAGSS